jgi:hypothetical protein
LHTGEYRQGLERTEKEGEDDRGDFLFERHAEEGKHSKERKSHSELQEGDLPQ